LIIQEVDAAPEVGINRKIKPAIEELVNENISLKSQIKRLKRQLASINADTKVVAV
jgi:regulator of replication initiation timing